MSILSCFPRYWHIIVYNSFGDHLFFCSISCSSSIFISDFIDWTLYFFSWLLWLKADQFYLFKRHLCFINLFYFYFIYCLSIVYELFPSPNLGLGFLTFIYTSYTLHYLFDVFLLYDIDTL